MPPSFSYHSDTGCSQASNSSPTNSSHTSTPLMLPELDILSILSSTALHTVLTQVCHYSLHSGSFFSEHFSETSCTSGLPISSLFLRSEILKLMKILTTISTP